MPWPWCETSFPLAGRKVGACVVAGASIARVECELIFVKRKAPAQWTPTSPQPPNQRKPSWVLNQTKQHHKTHPHHDQEDYTSVSERDNFLLSGENAYLIADKCSCTYKTLGCPLLFSCAGRKTLPPTLGFPEKESKTNNTIHTFGRKTLPPRPLLSREGI